MNLLSPRSRYRYCKGLTLTFAGLAGMTAFALVGVSLAKEAGSLIEELGRQVFAADALLRLGFGFVVSCLTALPYLICWLALALTQRARSVASFATVLFFSKLACYLQLLLTETSSTAALGFFFYPLVFSAGAILFGTGLAVFKRLSRDPEALPTAAVG